MQIKQWLSESIAQLNDADVSSPRLDCLIMLEMVLEADRSSIIARDNRELEDNQLITLDELISERQKRIPLAYLTGSRNFYGLELKVTDSVLVPRPETETLVKKAIEIAKKNSTVLELGTGSGAIALALASKRPDLAITATDVSADALKVAKLNATDLRLAVEFIESDLFEQIAGKFPLILANLPYVPVGARRQREIEYEPDVSLYGGDDGLDFYRTFFNQLADYLQPKGKVIVEFSPTQYSALRASYRNYKFEPLSEYIYLVRHS